MKSILHNKRLKDNKKGNIIILILFFLGLFLLLFIGFIMIVGSSVINYVFDISVPELNNLGMIEDTNMTEIADATLVPANTLVQSFTWLTGVLYVMFLIGLVGLILVMRITPNRWLLSFFFLLMIMLIMGSIIISNIYEDFYDDVGSELSTRLAEHTILSWMILYSPAIFTVIGFLVAVVLFSGLQEEFV